MSKQQRIRVRLADGRLLSLKVVSVSFGDAIPAPPPPAFDIVDIRMRTRKPKQAPGGCPRCAHALSLMPDLSERIY